MNSVQKQRWQRLVERVQQVVDRHDPFSLLEMGAPADEWESVAHRIVSGLAQCEDEEGCLTLVWDVFRGEFGDSAGPREAFADMAREIYSLASTTR